MQCIYEVDERTSRVHSTLQDLNDYGDFFHRKKGTSKIKPLSNSIQGSFLK